MPRNFKRFLDRKEKEDKLICCYCARKLTRREATVEHIIPAMYKDIIRGLGQSNMDVACAKCNTKRSKIQSHIAQLTMGHLLWDMCISSTFAYLNSERHHVTKLGEHFVDKLTFGFWTYDYNSRKMYCQYEG